MNKTKTFMIISLILFFISAGLIISMNGIDKQTADTSTAYTATVSNVEINGTGKNISVLIQTNEYDTDLYLTSDICKNINPDDIRALKNEQTISFTIENIRAAQMNDVTFLPITSLETATKAILSLDDYNNYMQTAAYTPRNTAIILAAGCVIVAVYSFIKIRKDKKTQ